MANSVGFAILTGEFRFFTIKSHRQSLHCGPIDLYSQGIILFTGLRATAIIDLFYGETSPSQSVLEAGYN